MNKNEIEYFLRLFENKFVFVSGFKNHEQLWFFDNFRNHSSTVNGEIHGIFFANKTDNVLNFAQYTLAQMVEHFDYFLIIGESFGMPSFNKDLIENGFLSKDYKPFTVICTKTKETIHFYDPEGTLCYCLNQKNIICF